MYRTERWPDEESEPAPRSRSSSRRSSASLSRRSSLKREGGGGKHSPPLSAPPAPSAPASTTATPKKTHNKQALDFLVTGKQILKRGERANSLPGSYHRRTSVDPALKHRKLFDSPKRAPVLPHTPATPTPATPRTPKSVETSLEDDMSLDLSQVSDFEDTNSKYGMGHAMQALATSTPLPARRVGTVGSKPRSASLQSQLQSARVETRRALHSLDSTKHSLSRDSFNTSSSSPHRAGTDLDYSSVSPEYSGQSSGELSPTRASQQIVSPRSQDLQLSSCCVSTWADCSEASTAVEGRAGRGRKGEHGTRAGCDGEWCSFWANYNNSLTGVPVKGYYDQCPTPYRTETFDLADFELSEGSRKRSPDNVEVINNIIRNQGLQLTPRETQNIIKCAHLLGNVLSKAIDRRCKNPDDPELLIKKKTMTLDLKETSIPLEVKEQKTSECATTQTDISLPNTKSAPRIFENILRQLSRSSIDVDKIENKEKTEAKSEGDTKVEKTSDVTQELKKDE